MRKGWSVVIAIVMVTVLLGAICIGVGMFTGADMTRIYSALDNRYMITQYYEWGIEALAALKAALL